MASLLVLVGDVVIIERTIFATRLTNVNQAIHRLSHDQYEDENVADVRLRRV